MGILRAGREEVKKMVSDLSLNDVLGFADVESMKRGLYVSDEACRNIGRMSEGYASELAQSIQKRLDVLFNENIGQDMQKLINLNAVKANLEREVRILRGKINTGTGEGYLQNLITLKKKEKELEEVYGEFVETYERLRHETYTQEELIKIREEVTGIRDDFSKNVNDLIDTLKAQVAVLTEARVHIMNDTDKIFQIQLSKKLGLNGINTIEINQALNKGIPIVDEIIKF